MIRTSALATVLYVRRWTSYRLRLRQSIAQPTDRESPSPQELPSAVLPEVIGGITSEEEEQELGALNRWIVEQDLPQVILAYAFAGANTSEPYKSLKETYEHHTVKHSVSEYVNGMTHTNGIESFWAMLKRGYHGVYHKMSVNYLGRYINEFTGRHNTRPMDTLEQMQDIFRGMEGKRLRYVDLIAR